jgi:hypothetical protein
MSVYKRGDVWVADFYLGGRTGRRVRRAAPSKELAEAMERDSKVREFRGELDAQEMPDVTLSAFIETYKELYSPTKTESTRQRDTYTIGHVQPFFKDPVLRHVTKEKIEKYMSMRLKLCRSLPSTVNWTCSRVCLHVLSSGGTLGSTRHGG